MRNNFHKPRTNWFAVFVVSFIGIVFTLVILQMGLVGYVMYKGISDPHGTAQFIGEIAAEAVKPVMEAVQE